MGAWIAFWAVGLPSPIFWGVVTGLFALLPVIGPWMVWVPAVALLVFEGETGRAIALFLLGHFGVSGVDNIIRPLFISRGSNLNGLVVVVSLFGGLHVFGMLGVVMGPTLAAITLGMLIGYRADLVAKGGVAAAGGSGAVDAAAIQPASA